jgi:hypothetical protein
MVGYSMQKTFAVSTVLLAALLPWQANAGTINFSFAGSGASGTITLTYGTATDGKYSQAFEVTGISGTFSDTNNGLNIVNATIGQLVPINYATPEATNLLAPLDFSLFAVAAGLPPGNNGHLSYDNLFYPGGSPQTASDYPGQGGILDIYGLLFNIGGGRVVNLWSNGNFGSGPIDYGVAVATSNTSLDYVSGDVSITPEPGTFGLLGSVLLGMLVWRRASRSEAALKK